MSSASRLAVCTFAIVLAGCASKAGGTKVASDHNASLLSSNAPVTCAEWVARAKASPELDVDRVPAPRAYDPAPVPRRMPPGAAGKDGVAEVRIKVLVDTLGHADMRTFQVVRSTHPTLTKSVRTAVAKWTFEPAVVHGCKVPRIFNWAATAGTPHAQPAAKPAAKTSRG